MENFAPVAQSFRYSPVWGRGATQFKPSSIRTSTGYGFAAYAVKNKYDGDSDADEWRNERKLKQFFI